jgi:hypothetical protein
MPTPPMEKDFQDMILYKNADVDVQINARQTGPIAK